MIRFLVILSFLILNQSFLFSQKDSIRLYTKTLDGKVQYFTKMTWPTAITSDSTEIKMKDILNNDSLSSRLMRNYNMITSFNLTSQYKIKFTQRINVNLIAVPQVKMSKEERLEFKKTDTIIKVFDVNFKGGGAWADVIFSDGSNYIIAIEADIHSLGATGREAPDAPNYFLISNKEAYRLNDSKKGKKKDLEYAIELFEPFGDVVEILKTLIDKHQIASHSNFRDIKQLYFEKYYVEL